MTHVTVTTQIDAPLDVVFRRFSDIEHGSARVSSIHHIDMLTPGPIRVGTKWIETPVVLGRADSAEMELTAFQRNRMFTITHHKAGVQINATFWFEPKDTATIVMVEFEAEGGMLPLSLLRPLGWALQRKIERLLAHDLADTKRAIEDMGGVPSRPS